MGYKVLPSYLRIIQGDGIDLSSVDEVRKSLVVVFVWVSRDSVLYILFSILYFCIPSCFRFSLPVLIVTSAIRNASVLHSYPTRHAPTVCVRVSVVILKKYTVADNSWTTSILTGIFIKKYAIRKVLRI